MYAPFLGALAKLQKATISFVIFCPSVCMEHLGCHWMNFHENWYLNIFRKSAVKIHVSRKTDNNNGYFTWRPIYIVLSYLAQFFLEWEMFQLNVVQKLETHIFMINNFLFRKSFFLWDNVEKYCRAGQATDNNITRRMHTECCIPKATNTHSEYVTLTAFPLQQRWHKLTCVTLYVHCLSCYFGQDSWTRQ